MIRMVCWEAGVILHPRLPQPSVHPPTRKCKTEMKRSLHSFTWPEERRRRLAANCLDISCVLGSLITLPNPFSSLKHPQGSAALHAEPCKAKNSEGHSLQPPPHPGQAPSVPQAGCPEASLPTTNPIFRGVLGTRPYPGPGPWAKSKADFHPPVSLRSRRPSGRSYPVSTPTPAHQGSATPFPWGARLCFPMVSSHNSLYITA